MQRLSGLDGVGTGESNLTLEVDLILFGPTRYLLDREPVEWLERYVRTLIAATYRGEIDRNYPGVPLAAIFNRVTRQLRVNSIGGGIKAAAGTNQVADAHAGLERIVARHFDPTVNVHDFRRLPEIGLQAQFFHQRVNHMLATGLQIEHRDRVARHQLDIRGRAARLQGRGKISREHRNGPIGRQLTPDQQVVLIGVASELIDRGNDIADSQSVAPGDVLRPIDVTLQDDTGIKLGPQARE